MKIWQVSVPNYLSGMIDNSLFVKKEDAEKRYNEYKDRGAIIGQVNDIWGFCVRHFDDVIMNVVNSFYEPNGRWNSKKETEDGNSIDVERALIDAAYEVFCDYDMFRVDIRWDCDYNDFVFIAVSWVCQGKNCLWIDVYRDE